jgi:DNA polymerase elongation subunit (family B)
MQERLLNAYLDGRRVVLVRRDEHDEIRTRSVCAESCCFLRRKDVDRQLYRMLRSSETVRAVRREGPYYRVTWRDRHTSVSACKAFESRGIPAYEGDLSPVRRYLADNEPIIARPRRVYLDIETDSRASPLVASEGGARILCWALVPEGGEPLSACLEHDTDEAERALLRQLWRSLGRYDQVLAWYGDGFDFPAIRKRSKKLGIKVEHRRWLWLDALELFKRQNMMAAESGDEKQSMALGRVAQAVLGEGKHDFDSSQTWQAWVAGGAERERLVAYCVQDTRLMPAIEAKTGYAELLQTLCEAVGCFPDTGGLRPGTQVEMFMLRLAKQYEHKFPTRYEYEESERYKGAYVMEPCEKGIVHGVHVCDFASLYPSIIETWNMSPETKIASGGAQAAFTDICFDTSRKGLLPIAVAELLRLRRSWNERKAALPPGTDEWKEADRRSTAYKIAANSFYGVIGAPFSRFFDREVAESVTQCAVWLIQETMSEAERWGMRPIYGDTDSAFIAGCTREEFSDFVEHCNAELYPVLLKRRGCEINHIKLAYEKQFGRAVFVKAKRYIGSFQGGHYKGTEGTSESKPEVKGLEFKRGDSVRLARRQQEQIVHLLAGYKQSPSDEPEDYEEILRRYRAEVLTGKLERDDYVIVKGLSKPLKEYAVKRKKDGTDAAGAPHVEIARRLAAAGADMREGTRISYVCIDGSTSPKTYVPLEELEGEPDRYELWDSLVYPPTGRLLQAAFPEHDWTPWERTRPIGDRERPMVCRVTQDGQKLRYRARRGKAKPEGLLSLPWGELPVLEPQDEGGTFAGSYDQRCKGDQD